MIEFNYITDFELEDEYPYRLWVEQMLNAEGFTLGEISYIFCDDDYLHDINLKYLDHDTLTDVISFPYSEGRVISGDIFMSVERIMDNCQIFDVPFHKELLRVMIHGVLHFCGYGDKTDKDIDLMRRKESEYILRFGIR